MKSRRSTLPMPSSSDAVGASVLERMETSNAGRWVLSVVLVVNLGAIVAWNLPNSALREAVAPVIRPYLNATGLSQSWTVFAPDPAKQTFEVFATIDYADGSSARWRPPEGGAFVGHYRGYRWRKWAGYVNLNSREWMWAPTARWLEGNYDHDGRRPIRVELARRWKDLEAPGSGQPDGEWHEYVYYTLDLTRASSS